MGIIQSIMGIFGPPRRAAAPFQTTSNIPPQENYAGYTMLPSPPMSPGGGDYVPDPLRLHAPFQTTRSRTEFVSAAGVQFFDAGDPAVTRVPDQPLQLYFNQVEEIPVPPALIKANGVFVPDPLLQYGWQQQYVPEPGMRADEVGITPPVLLSTPLKVVSIVESGRRAPITGARSHPPKKG